MVATRRMAKQRIKTPYIGRVVNNSRFIKLGCSNDPARRLRDRNFGKAPRTIKRSVRKRENRFIDTIFIPGTRATLSGDVLERYFHKHYEEQHRVGEWLPAEMLATIVEFFKANGFTPRKVRLTSSCTDRT